MDLEFSGEVLFWRGPVPKHVLSVPDELCERVELGDTVSVGLTIDV